MAPGKLQVIRWEVAHEVLRVYLRQYKPKTWLFPRGAPGGRHLHERSVQKVFQRACKRSGIEAGFRPGGTSLRYIQELLGHQSSKTTEIFTHVSTKDLGRIRSPLDDFMGPDGTRSG